MKYRPYVKDVLKYSDGNQFEVLDDECIVLNIYLLRMPTGPFYSSYMIKYAFIYLYTMIWNPRSIWLFTIVLYIYYCYLCAGRTLRKFYNHDDIMQIRIHSYGWDLASLSTQVFDVKPKSIVSSILPWN